MFVHMHIDIIYTYVSCIFYICECVWYNYQYLPDNLIIRKDIRCIHTLTHKERYVYIRKLIFLYIHIFPYMLKYVYIISRYFFNINSKKSKNPEPLYMYVYAWYLYIYVFIIYLVWALWETENFDFFGFSIFSFCEDIHCEPKMVKVSMRLLDKITVDQK